jgi:hypothetical protein
VQIIIREENILAESERPLTGTKYAQGIVDVAQALLLLDKFGPKLSLSSQGYACYYLNRLPEHSRALDAFLLEKVINSDGEYTLNILQLVSEGKSDPIELGELLLSRFLKLIEYKMAWAQTHINERFTQRTMSAFLTESQRVLKRALAKEARTVEFFYKHIVNPRLEWLRDLGCIEHGDSGQPTLSPGGTRVITQVKRLGGWREEFVILPLDVWLTKQLSIPNLYGIAEATDYSWTLVSACFGECVARSHIIRDAESLLKRVKTIYPFVKLANFNEADAASIHEVLSALEGASGRVVSQEEFEIALQELVKAFPSEIFKLSKRRGRGMYIALKTSR